MKEWLKNGRSLCNINTYKVTVLSALLLSVLANDSRVQPCLLFCKDNHMKEMESEWSSNFVFPLLSLLENTKNETAVYVRLFALYFSNIFQHFSSIF
ncbi:unnamed protein product [Enterobius vermicularis]|uniref:Secreted protein n=1 Tax=Enterobius vermicularis TaxID=51028 RepID=A0A0N4VH48_ENTVE|nr:unnamed protein product [Enterobius vermicularis]